MLKKSKVCTALMLAFGGSVGLTVAPAFAQQPAAQPVERVEVTGSRIKRADVEGALPVTVINRAELEASGSTTVAEFMRSTTFSSAGNFRPQSGSSAQSFAGIDLRGLGSDRTLVLLDGRRLPKAPNVGDSVDLNAVPMAAVERIEILTDGASAVYGSDAIGGVVNIITRKDFEGLQAVVGYTRPKNEGGAKKEASVLLGVQGEKGRLLMGASKTGRAMVYTRDRQWGQTRGASAYGNNYFNQDDELVSIGNLKPNPATGTIDPAYGCTDPNFYMTASGTCSYNFNAVAADEAQIDNHSYFARGETQISNDWKAYVSASATNTTSFGRYAPTPAGLTVVANSFNNPSSVDVDVLHRTAAAGNRDTNTDGWLGNVATGFQGKVTQNIELDVGFSYTRSTYKELGRNYIVRPILEQYVNDGSYNLYAPNANSETVLSSIKATIGRDSFFKQKDLYAIATMYDLFQLPGGGASLLASVERRNEAFADVYDSLSEAGVIEGSAGNSAAGKRTVTGAAVEMVMPISKTLEASLAGRFDKYSDYGNDFSPKASVRWQPLKSLTVRASIGEGFRAPSLPQLNQKETFSAESVLDPRTCVAFGGATTGEDEDNCNVGKQVQVNTYTAANSALKSEKSKQWSVGAVWDATSYLSLKADYASIEIQDKLTLITAQDLIDRTNGVDPRAVPAGLYVQRNAADVITRVQQGFANEGTLEARYLDVSAQLRWKSAAAGSFAHELRYSNTLEYNDGGEEVRGTVGLPRYRATLSNDWKLGPFAVNFNTNLVGRNGVVAARTANAYTTHDLQGSYNTPWKGKIIVGALNIGNKQPELVAYDGRNFNFNLYDSYGRQVYVRLEQKF